MNTPERINQYIAEHPEWQRKLLVRMRQLVHAAAPQVEETWRWNTPHFDHAGAAILGISGNKACVTAWFHHAGGLKDPKKLFAPAEAGKDSRVYKLKEGDVINEAAFTDLVNRAIAIAEKGQQASAPPVGCDDDGAPEELLSVLRKDPSAWANWTGFSPSCRREYVEWISDGLKEQTRNRRIAMAFEMIRDGVAREEDLRLKDA